MSSQDKQLDKNTLDIALISPPSMVALYFKALRKLIFNRKHHQQFTPYGYQTGASPSSLQQLLRYCELCHFEYNGSIPATYPHLLSFSLQLKIVTDSRFPVSLAGLVHTKNIITQYRPIAPNEALTIRCVLTETRGCDKGLEFDIETKVWSCEELVWESVSTNLSRKQNTDRNKENPPSRKDAYSNINTKKEQANALEFSLSPKTARQYAVLGGDFNPIHIHWCLARLMGFKDMLIHGMYSKARSLAELEKQGVKIKPPLRYQVNFKTPAFLPSTMCLRWERKKESGLVLYLDNKRSKKPHLSGEIIALESLE